MVTKEAKTEAAPAATPAAEPKNQLSPCMCSRFSVLVNLRESDKDGDLVWDEELTTGCDGRQTKSTFLPGHDAKLKSALIKWGVEGHDVQENTGGMAVIADAVVHAKKFGFDHMVTAGISRALERAADKKAAQQAKALKAGAPKKASVRVTEKKTAPAPAAPLADVVAAEEAAHKETETKKVAEREKTADWTDADETNLEKDLATAGEATVDLTGRPEVTAKVGRWEYRGVVSDAGWLHYLAKDGVTRKTAKPGKFEVLSEV